MSERRVVDIKVLWTNLYRSVRTLLMTFVKPIESATSYKIVETVIRRRDLIDELEDERYHILLKINVRGKSLSANEVIYSLIPLSLTYLPKIVSEKDGYSIGFFVFEGFNKPKLIAASITVNKELNSDEVLLRPVLMSLSSEVSEHNVKVFSDKISGIIWSEVRYYLGRYAPRYSGIIRSLNLMKPIMVMMLRSGVKKFDEIRAVVSDGSEYREVKIPIKVPTWGLGDLPPRVVEDVETMVIKPIVKSYPFAPKGAFITGPPGVGKSVMADALASALGLKIVELRPSTYRSMWYGATEKMLNAIFNQVIKRRSEIALVIDDAEFISSRKYTIHEAHISEISTILYHLQRPDRPFTILTANNPELIDPALLRPGRIDATIVLGYPDKHMRRKIIEKGLSIYGIRADEEVIDAMVRDSKWFSSAEVDAFVRLAASKGEGRIGKSDVEWAKKKLVINISERRSIQEYLRWWTSKAQGIVMTYIPSDNEVE